MLLLDDSKGAARSIETLGIDVGFRLYNIDLYHSSKDPEVKS